MVIFSISIAKDSVTADKEIDRINHDYQGSGKVWTAQCEKGNVNISGLVAEKIKCKVMSVKTPGLTSPSDLLSRGLGNPPSAGSF